LDDEQPYEQGRLTMPYYILTDSDWSFEDNDDGGCDIVFAENPMEAARIVAQRHADADGPTASGGVYFVVGEFERPPKLIGWTGAEWEHGKVTMDTVWNDAPKESNDNAPAVYTVGDHTMSRVFKPAGLTDVSDLQAVLDRVEQVLLAQAQLNRLAKDVCDSTTHEDVDALPEEFTRLSVALVDMAIQVQDMEARLEL
jgi:hypothetical protein